jgi:hypothetical protein
MAQYKIVYLPTCEYVIDGNSKPFDPQVLYFDNIDEAKDTLIHKFFKPYKNRLDKFGRSAPDIIFCSDTQFGVKDIIPNHLFDIIEVPNV